jgi:predicted SAM-dependent methyltransferase
MAAQKSNVTSESRLRQAVTIGLLRSGGAKQAVGRLLALLRREGWKGLKRRWIYILGHEPWPDRDSKALVLVNRQGLGLEIGPSHRPIASKKQGFNVHVLDHASAEELREKYAEHNVDLANIEDVDFVWHGEPLSQLIGREECYDWIIASHVIEHSPDLIAFLNECERLLKPDGVLSLVIPDKRYCFDCVHALTSTGELLDAFDQRRKRPSPGKVFDHFAGATKRNGQISWNADTRGAIKLVHGFSEAMECWQRARTTDQYIDVHNWRFTPASFRLILNDLQALGLVRLEIKIAFDTVDSEFYMTLGKAKSPHPVNRLSVLQDLLDESASSLAKK